MCDCYEEMLEKANLELKKMIRSELSEPLESSYDNEFWGRSDEKTKIKNVMLRVTGKFRYKKKDGTPHQRPSEKHISIAFSFCPFCGEDLRDSPNKA